LTTGKFLLSKFVETDIFTPVYEIYRSVASWPVN
jgi:hypothetical protein